VAIDSAEESVLDASVMLALLRNERSDEDLIDLIDDAILSAVNLSEVLTKAVELGLAGSPLLAALLVRSGGLSPSPLLKLKLLLTSGLLPPGRAYTLATALAWHWR
jgi:hypothetical protein